MFALVLVYHIMCSALTHIIYISCHKILYYVTRTAAWWINCWCMVKVGRLETHREDKMKRFKEYTDNKVDIIQGGRIDMISLVCAHLLFISYAHISCSYKSHLTARCRSTLYLYCKSWSMEERGWCIVMIVCRMITLLQGEWEWGGFDLASPAVNEEEEAEDEACVLDNQLILPTV